MADLSSLFNPKSIAIVGASEEKGKVGNAITKNILKLGYQGQVFLVNPKHDSLFSQKCYEDLKDVEGQVDLAIIVIPAKLVNSVIQENAKKIKNYVVISAGFSEIGEEGKAREEELKKIAEENDLNILGPNCLGFIIPSLKLNASFAGGLPKEGNIAFVSQSGALITAVLDIAGKKNLSFSKIISIGNKTDFGEAEILDYLEKDSETKVIAMYLEGIKDGPGFIEASRKTSKPIVVLKAGKTEKAQKAISSHTGALAGSDEITSAVFEKCGIIRADDLDQFVGLLKIISLSEAPENEGVVAITNAGGAGVLTTDAFKDKAVKLIDLDENIKSELKSVLPAESSVENPIDLLGDAGEDRYGKVLNIIEKTQAGSVICVLTPQAQTPVEKITEKIIEFKNNSQKNIVAVFIGGERVEKSINELEDADVPNFQYPEQAVEALDKYYSGKNHQRSASFGLGEIIGKLAHSGRKDKVLEIIHKAKSENRKALLFGEAKKIMEMYGIKTSEFWTEDLAAEANPACNAMLSITGRFPVVVKVDSDKVLHKTDKQGLILNVKNQEELQKAIETIKSNFPGENVIIQPMLPIKNELIVGVKRDSVFGPIVVFGLGGIYTEVFKMADFLIPPMKESEIEEFLLQSKISFLFQETRGQKPCDAKEMAKILWGIESLAEEIPEIKEIDINPLLIYNDDQEATTVDVKIII